MRCVEFLDIYTPQHERTGRTIPRNGRVLEGERLLVVHVCVLNSRNEMLIQRRQLTKDRYPGCWDLSAGGFARSGEASAEAAGRELREELGLDLSPDALCYLFTEPFSYVLDDFYHVRADLSVSELQLQTSEVLEARWATQQEILQMIDSGAFVDYDPACIARVFRLSTK